MAIGKYEIWLSHWNGTRLLYLDTWQELQYTRALHNVGALSLTLPSSFDTSYLVADYKIEVWRALPGQSKTLENVYLIRGWRKWTDENGVNHTKITGLDGNDIMRRRIVLAEGEDQAQARKTGYGANLIKAYMREAIADYGGYGYSTNHRDDIAAYFTVQANTNEWAGNAAASFTEKRQFQTMFDTANGICERSAGRGFPIRWYVYPVSGSAYQLRTYQTLFGQDLTSTGIVIKVDTVLGDAVHEYDATDEYTVVVAAGGQIGVGTYPYYRKTDGRADYNRYHNTAFSYREKFLNMFSEPDYDIIYGAIDEELAREENIPLEYFTGKINEFDSFRYGRDWNLGDKLRFDYRGLQTTGEVELIGVTVQETERISMSMKIPINMDIR